MAERTFSGYVPNGPSVEDNTMLADPTDFLGDMGFAAAFPGPTKVKIGGAVVEILPLDITDYIPWLRELEAKVKESRMKAIPSTATPLERWKIATNIEELELSCDAIMDYVFRPSWTEKIARKILEKAKVTNQEVVDAFIAKRPAKANEMFVAYFSGLFTVNQFNSIYKNTTAQASKPEAPPPATFGGSSRPLPTAPAPLSESAGDSSSNSLETSEEKSTGLSSVTESNRQPSAILTK